MKQYAVIAQSDRVSGKFDPKKLERTLNEHAGVGWILKAVVTADVPSLGGSKQEIIMVFECDVAAPPSHNSSYR